ncbi:MAG: tryptophan--tRNA ligase [Campylobacterota bacterium]
MSKKIVSGMRPTGQLHLGHYYGVLQNWVDLQQDNDAMFFVADWHALSTSYEDKLNLRRLSLDLVKDWISAGLDEKQVSMFVQSQVKEHAELYLLLNMITPLGWLERNPTYKDMMANLQGKEINTGGFLTYPVLQAADIIIYDADAVPIGEDQRPHLELAREIVRRFHHLYECDVFVEPKEILTQTARLQGLDGRKMSKSYNNAIFLSDSSKEVWDKLKKAKTDPGRVRKDDPGNPDICLVYEYHKSVSSADELSQIRQDCQAGTIGCVACKKQCAKNIDTVLEPMRQRRAKLDDSYIEEVIDAGNTKARQKAAAKLQSVRDIIFNIKG